ncbi:uncharacterized protein LOC122064552 [Macadamia integrifolia]|uniref:uncharacterized protein LOC122064552 n=1 Tax=Macadamia integrifolia TaxID=60698 RepID=UPI001C4F46DC|nr:uncharacterized protein LOC122064552 [Macadamia integrifolia]
MASIWKRSPVKVGAQLLRFQRWCPDFSIHEKPVKKNLVWVRFPDLPLEYWHEKVLLKMAKAAGRPVALDHHTKTLMYGNSARVLVEMDAGSARPEEIQVERQQPGTANLFWFEQKVLYKDSMGQCGFCKKVGHVLSDCKEKKIEDSRARRMEPNQGVPGAIYVNDSPRGTVVPSTFSSSCRSQQGDARDAGEDGATLHGSREEALGVAEPTMEERGNDREDSPILESSLNMASGGVQTPREDMMPPSRRHSPLGSNVDSLSKNNRNSSQHEIPNFEIANRADTHPNLWIMWKQGLRNPLISSISEQHLSVQVEWNGRMLNVSMVHAKCLRVERRSLWMDLVSGGSGAPRMIIGDFNATLYDHDRRGPGRFFVGAASEFAAMVDALALIQIPSAGRKFTWTNNRRRGNVVAVLDRTFVNEEWMKIFDDCIQKVLIRVASDHASLMACSKLKALKPIIRSWSREAFPNLDQEVITSKAELENIQRSIEKEGLTEQLFDQEADANTKYWKAMENQEKLWLQKSRVRWLKEGDRILQDLDQEMLDAIPFEEEIKRAVWDLNPYSSPGPDGFTGAFFRKCWDIIHDDVYRAVKGFFSSGSLSEGKLSQTNISLASELENLMGQTSRGGGLGLKVDIKKAFDTISKDFLFQVLRQFGFSEKMIGWIHTLLQSAKISVLLNGGPVVFFEVSRGVRQGDPISPILFIIAKEVLCRGVSDLAAKSQIKPLSSPHGADVPTHLLFADDVFIFMNASKRYVRNLKSFLTIYQKCSGQFFNLEKSKLFLGKIPSVRKQWIAEELDIPCYNFPTKYLGVEIFQGRVKRDPLLPVMDKIKAKLAG